MIKLGEYQELIVVKKVEFGVYLAQKPEDETRVLLPAKQVPQEVKIGDVLKVFLYKGCPGESCLMRFLPAPEATRPVPVR